LAAVAGQLLADAEGDAIHRNLQPRYLLTPPELFGAARRAARDMAAGTDDLVVRAESRLGTGGVINPRTDSIVTGNATNWMLAAPSDQAAAVAIGSLNGRVEPTIRDYPLEGGRWGRGVDVFFDVAASVVTPEALYWSTGDDS
jgi:hypothetical protein